MTIVKLTYPHASRTLVLLVLGLAPLGGCALFPETRLRDSVHNPFPQLKKVAIVPFFNQSNEPTLNTEMVTRQYYAALQAIPGFEVLPIGVSRLAWMRFSSARGEPRSGADFQQLAKELGVEAIIVGSVTEFDAYYPPRLAMTVHWYAANEGFHPIPAGYGLPWGTEGEQDIPRRIVREAEFELARSQLATQTPPTGMPPLVDTVDHEQPLVAPVPPAANATSDGHVVPGALVPPGENVVDLTGPDNSMQLSDIGPSMTYEVDPLLEASLPPSWPDPTDLIPDPPSPVPPPVVVNREPILTHTRLYRGDDAYVTERLADYVETGDDARPGGWQGYLKRNEDFVHFCCHLHIVEMLESRGGRDQSDLIFRWPLSRY